MSQPAKCYQQPVIPVVKKETLISLPPEKLRVDTVGRVYYFPVNDIVRIQAFSNYSKIFFNTGKNILVAKILARFEYLLSHSSFQKPGQEYFVRIHRSHLINKRYLLYYVPGNEAKVCLSNGEKIPVSKRRKAIFKLIESLK